MVSEKEKKLALLRAKKLEAKERDIESINQLRDEDSEFRIQAMALKKLLTKKNNKAAKAGKKRNKK